MATYADGTKEYRLSDKVGNLYNDPDKKLRKYLEGGRIEKSGEWIFKMNLHSYVEDPNSSIDVWGYLQLMLASYIRLTLI